MKKIIVISLTVIAGMFLCGAVDAGSLNVSIINSMPYNGTNAHGITYAHEYLWIADSDDLNVYKINPDNGIVEYTIQVNTESILSGLTWDSTNSNLLLTEFGGETNNIYTMDVTGNILSSFPTPGGDSTGLAISTNHIYNGDFTYGGVIHKILISDTSNVETIKAPSATPEGLTYVDGFLWHVDHDGNIYKLDTNCNIISQGDTSLSGLVGLTYDGQYFWTTDAGTIYQIDVQETECAQSAIFDTQTRILNIPSVLVGNREFEFSMQQKNRDTFKLINVTPK